MISSKSTEIDYYSFNLDWVLMNRDILLKRNTGFFNTATKCVVCFKIVSLENSADFGS